MSDFLLNTYKNDVELLTIPDFEKTGIVKAVFTTRNGGISGGAFTSLNMGENTEDKPENIMMNYQNVCDALEIENTYLVSLKQIHSDKIFEVTRNKLQADKIEPQVKRIKLGEGDALVTNEKGIPLLTVHADCIPVYLLDVRNKAIGLAHSGWKGTVQEIAVKTYERMQYLYDSRPEDIIAAIGPGIDFCCFEIGLDVFDVFKAKFFQINAFSKAKGNGKYMIDLKDIIRKQLEEKGISRIILSKDCTFCRNDLFFSHRRDHGNTGRMAAIMELI